MQRETERQRQQMELAAAALPPLPAPTRHDGLRVHLLTGSRFWYQTAFCIHSLARTAGEPIAVDLYDDGTMTGAVRSQLARLGTAIRFHDHAEIVARLDRELPTARFPVLRERWLNYPNLRKLTDVHVGERGWKLVLDSDLLFFHRPTQLLDWVRTPRRPLHAVDCTESYGYSRPLLARLAGGPIPRLVNVGVTGWRSEAIDWEELETWCAELLARERTNYYLEQALIAMLAARQQCDVLPAEDYVTRPGRTEAHTRRATMHHYVAESKRWYFQVGWQAVLGNQSGPAS